MEPIKEESMCLTERTQSVSSVLKIPMDFNEFKTRYNELLNHHLKENSYHDELTFIKMWFDRYSKLSDLLQKIAKPEPLTLLEKRGLKALGTKNHYSDLELSFSLICKFLKKTKKEVKRELKTKPVAPQQNEIINTDEVKKNKPDSKIPYTVMNEAILSIQASLVDDIKTPQQPEAVKLDEVYKTQNLFKVGLLFATGEMNKYFKIKGNNQIVMNNGLSPLKIAKELGNPSFEKIILASKNNYRTDNANGNKNIFNNLDMMTKIISDCEAKNIPVEPYFISRLPIE